MFYYCIIYKKCLKLKNNRLTNETISECFYSKHNNKNIIKLRIIETATRYTLTAYRLEACKYYMSYKFLKTLCTAGLFGLEWILILMGAALLLIYSISYKKAGFDGLRGYAGVFFTESKLLPHIH